MVAQFNHCHKHLCLAYMDIWSLSEVHQVLSLINLANSFFQFHLTAKLCGFFWALIWLLLCGSSMDKTQHLQQPFCFIRKSYIFIYINAQRSIRDHFLTNDMPELLRAKLLVIYQIWRQRSLCISWRIPFDTPRWDKTGLNFLAFRGTFDLDLDHIQRATVAVWCRVGAVSKMHWNRDVKLPGSAQKWRAKLRRIRGVVLINKWILARGREWF